MSAGRRPEPRPRRAVLLREALGHLAEATEHAEAEPLWTVGHALDAAARENA